MRWTFWRDDEMLVCELGLNRDDSAYELRIDPPTNPIGITTQIFDDVTPAFERHGSIERLLIDGGWSLEGFESGATDGSSCCQEAAKYVPSQRPGHTAELMRDAITFEDAE